MRIGLGIGFRHVCGLVGENLDNVTSRFDTLDCGVDASDWKLTLWP